MIKGIALTIFVVIFLAGCIGGLADIYSSKQDVAPAEIEDIRALLIESGQAVGADVKAILEARLIELESKLSQSEVYRAGKQATLGIWQLLTALGVVGGTGATLLQRKKRVAAEASKASSNADARTLGIGLRVLEQAILDAGSAGKDVTGKIKSEGSHVIAAVNRARAVAHNGPTL